MARRRLRGEGRQRALNATSTLPKHSWFAIDSYLVKALVNQVAAISDAAKWDAYHR